MTRFLFIQGRSSSFFRPIVVGETENRQLSQFLFQLPNPLLQELPLWFLLGQGQSFLIRLGTDRTFNNLHSSKNWGTFRLSQAFLPLYSNLRTSSLSKGEID